MKEFFTHQLDYTFFFYSLASIVLAAISFMLHKRSKTQHRINAEKIEQDRINLETIFNAAQVGLLLVNERAEITRINIAISKLIGKDLGTLVGRGPGDGLCCIHAITAPQGCGTGKACPQCPIHSNLRRVLQTGEPMPEFEIQHLLRINEDVQLFWFSICIDPLTINGSPHALLAITDITASKQAEERVGQESAKLSAMISGMQEGIVFADTSDTIVEANPYFVEFVHLKRDRIVGQPLWALYTADMLEKIKNVVADYKNCANSDPFILQRKLGQMHVVMRLQPIYLDGCYDGALLNMIDVTEMVKVREDAEQAITEMELANQQLTVSSEQATLLAKEAQAANVAKSEFLANMSHEIRTPLNAIIGFGDLLLEEELSSAHRKYVNTLHDAAENFLLLVNNVLDFSKIESNKFVVEMIDCPLGELLGYLESLLRPIAQKKQLSFEVLQCSSLPATIRTDPLRLRQCLINLVNNAIKFTQKGYVYINASMEETANGNFIRLDVEDTGIGIPPDVQEAIFDPYVQADTSTTRKFGGTGLGLAITKKLVELLGGKILVKSEPNKGSVFSIIIPAGVEVNKQPVFDKYELIEHCIQKKEDAAPKNFSVDILVAEDNPANQLLIKILLKKMGIEAVIANNGQEAVEHASQRPFDLIFMDMQMPILNGYDATRILHKRSITTPIVALTANAMKGDEEKCREAGCDGYVTKPISPQKLREALQHYLPATITSASSPPAATAAASPSVAGRIVSELANDPDLRAVAELFVGQVPTMLNEINNAVAKFDKDLMKRLTHTFKGASGSAGFPLLAEKAANIERHILCDAIDSLKAEVDQLNILCQNLSCHQEDFAERNV